MPRVVEPAQLKSAATLRKHLAKYQDLELLLQIGEYKRGADGEADEAIRYNGPIRKLLEQSSQQLSSFEDSVRSLRELLP